METDDEPRGSVLAQSQRVFAAAFLSGATFFWYFSLPFGGGDLPIYLLGAPLLGVLLLSRSMISNYFAILLLLTISLLFANIFGATLTTPKRTLGTLFVLPLALVVVQRSLKICADEDWRILKDAFGYLILAQAALQIFQVAFPDLVPWLDTTPHYVLPIVRPTGFFNEPSHFAFSMAPMIFLVVFRPSVFVAYFGKLALAAMILGILICPSATLFGVLASAFLARLVAFPLNSTAFWGRLALVLVVLAIAAERLVAILPDDILSRLEGAVTLIAGQEEVSDELASAAVFYQGFDMARLALAEFPFGAGLQNVQMLAEHPGTISMPERWEGLNTKDAASILFRLIAEFGYLAVALYIYACGRFVALIRNAAYFEASLVFALAATSFRGHSYFDGPVLLSLGFILLLSSRPNLSGGEPTPKTSGHGGPRSPEPT